jgi:hypothetical protein
MTEHYAPLSMTPSRLDSSIFAFAASPDGDPMFPIPPQNDH